MEHRLLFWPCVACVLLAGCAGDRPTRTTRPRLTGTNWVVESIGERPVTLLEHQKPLQLVLSEQDNRAAAYGGVNRFGGSYQLDGERLTFGPMISTKMAGPHASNQQEARFAAALDAANAFRLAGDQLILLKDETPLVTLRARP